MIAKMRKRIEYEQDSKNTVELDLFRTKSQNTLFASRRSSLTPEGGSPASTRPVFFDDNFHFEVFFKNLFFNKKN